jgi:GT2 family glycosyltransferase
MDVKKNEYPAVTVGIVNYNGKDVLPVTLHSILNQHYPAFNVIVVDNASEDGSREWLSQWEGDGCPQIRCIFLDENKGSAAGRNRILQEASTDYVFLVDNDIIIYPDTLCSLVDILQKIPGAAACHPEITDPQDPLVYHYNGGWMHYLGVYISRDKPGDLESRPEYEVYDVTSGGAILVDREIALKVGAFDNEFFFNMEDGDFTARITLAGYLCLNIPHAVVLHNSQPRDKSKVFFQVRNRLFFIAKLYSNRSLLISAPALILFEILQAGFLVLKGAGLEYLKANHAFIKSLPSVIKKRKEFLRVKKLQDRDWLKSGKMFVPNTLVEESRLKTVINGLGVFFALYWRLAKRFS